MITKIIILSITILFVGIVLVYDCTHHTVDKQYWKDEYLKDEDNE